MALDIPSENLRLLHHLAVSFGSVDKMQSVITPDHITHLPDIPVGFGSEKHDKVSVLDFRTNLFPFGTFPFHMRNLERTVTELHHPLTLICCGVFQRDVFIAVSSYIVKRFRLEII